jgi:hypothetical protein
LCLFVHSRDVSEFGALGRRKAEVGGLPSGDAEPLADLARTALHPRTAETPFQEVSEMTAQRAELASRANRYRSLRNFYLADRCRRSSREDDVGLWWRVGLHGPLYRAAWVRNTGELYVTRLGRHQDGAGEVQVLGRADDRHQLDAALNGWQDACPAPDSLTWLRHRAASLTPA